MQSCWPAACWPYCSPWHWSAKSAGAGRCRNCFTGFLTSGGTGMEKTQMTIRAAAAIALVIAVGCSGDDGRLAEFAKNSVEQQTRQNEQIAKQNHEVTRQNEQVAEGARKLVEADARARQ